MGRRLNASALENLFKGLRVVAVCPLKAARLAQERLLHLPLQATVANQLMLPLQATVANQVMLPLQMQAAPAE